MTTVADRPGCVRSPAGPQSAMLPDGRRLHLHHGPIDLIVEAWGAKTEVASAYCQAGQAFQTVLGALVEELSLLRTPVDAIDRTPTGPVARRMCDAASVHADRFVTPMAAVAGAVAEHILAAVVNGRELSRAYVNNGGDIALHVSRGARFDIAVLSDALAGSRAGTVTLRAQDGIAGVATSGWRGRSFSFGIADAVTVLAKTASAADVAATLIAGAVDLPGCPAINRAPARESYPDSDLGDRLVTRGVGELTPDEIAEALERGASVAAQMVRSGTIGAALLCLKGETRAVGLMLNDLLHHTKNRQRE